MVLSFVIPVFNVQPQLLRDCLASVRCQFPHRDCEVIVCDDGSTTDNSSLYKQIVASYSAHYFKLYRNLGMGSARNFGALRAKGRYVWFLDADDVLPVLDGSLLRTAFGKGPALVIGDHQNVAFDGTTVTRQRIKARYVAALSEFGGSIYDPLLYSTFIFHPLIFARNSFLDIGGFDIQYSSGDEIAAQLEILEAGANERFAYIPHILYNYRNNPDSVVHDPQLYRQLIGNLERIISRAASLRYGQKLVARKIGRSGVTGAAHYELTSPHNGIAISPPWLSEDFDITLD